MRELIKPWFLLEVLFSFGPAGFLLLTGGIRTAFEVLPEVIKGDLTWFLFLGPVLLGFVGTWGLIQGIAKIFSPSIKVASPIIMCLCIGSGLTALWLTFSILASVFPARFVIVIFLPPTAATFHICYLLRSYLFSFQLGSQRTQAYSIAGQVGELLRKDLKTEIQIFETGNLPCGKLWEFIQFQVSSIQFPLQQGPSCIATLESNEPVKEL